MLIEEEDSQIPRTLIKAGDLWGERFRFEIVSPPYLTLLSIFQTWPFVVSGRPDSDTKDVSAANRLCGTSA